MQIIYVVSQADEWQRLSNCTSGHVKLIADTKTDNGRRENVGEPTLCAETGIQ